MHTHTHIVTLSTFRCTFICIHCSWYCKFCWSSGHGAYIKKLFTQQDNSSLEIVDVVSIIIGLATFGQIAGLLRFLSYLDKYNMLLITLRLAMPSVLRFILCGSVLYMAFMLCGWLVLGPYHAKVGFNLFNSYVFFFFAFTVQRYVANVMHKTLCTYAT